MPTIKTKKILLCLNEKYEIASYKMDSLLNKRIEILGNCRHWKKYEMTSKNWRHKSIP